MAPEQGSIEAARDALRDGGLVVYPTDTLYGLGCLADREHAVERLLALTARPASKGLSVVFDSLQTARAWSQWTPLAQALAQAFLPGAMTLVLEGSTKAPRAVLSEQGTIGVRYVDREATLALAHVGPLVATSANPHGQASPSTVDQARSYFGDEVDAYVDAGRLEGPSSTVVDARGQRGTVIREGPISEDEIQEAAARGR